MEYLISFAVGFGIFALVAVIVILFVCLRDRFPLFWCEFWFWFFMIYFICVIFYAAYWLGRFIVYGM
jgi:hypothetical protein